MAVWKHPMIGALAVAAIGVGLIAYSSKVSADRAGGAIQPPKDFEQQRDAFGALQRAGVSGSLELSVFADGVGLAASRPIAAGDVIARVPEALALDPLLLRSCAETSKLGCRLEARVREAVLDGELSRERALLVLLVLERRRGAVPGLRETAVGRVLELLPEPAVNLFNIDAAEFRLLSEGTSMEDWREDAAQETQQAHLWIRAELSELGSVKVREVQAAYLILYSYGQWADEGDHDAFTAQVVLLAPLFLSRPTPEFEHGVRIRRNEADGVFEAFSTRPLRRGDEVHFVDRRLSDASALCFRGLWFTRGRHRTRLSLNVSSIKRDPKTQSLMESYGCSAQPLQLYLVASESIDPMFLSCMRMLALASNVSKLSKAERLGWTAKWPHTSAASHRSEAVAMELAVKTLQDVLTRLSTSSQKIRQQFGSDTVAMRPTVKVREAETLVAVSQLKALKQLPLLNGAGLDEQIPFDLDDHRRDQRRR